MPATLRFKWVHLNITSIFWLMLHVTAQGCDPSCLLLLNSHPLRCQARVKWCHSQSPPHFSYALVMHRVRIHGLQEQAGELRFCPAKPLPCGGCALPWGQAAVLHQSSALVNPPNAAVLPAVTLYYPRITLGQYVCSRCLMSSASVRAETSCSLGLSPLRASW